MEKTAPADSAYWPGEPGFLILDEPTGRPWILYREKLLEEQLHKVAELGRE